ncbi:hypothetical protein LDENG_00035460 [Lucifuga dentata]|nr:hypothetical protein LDENG_00035460 [Lucifuga dentata]
MSLEGEEARAPRGNPHADTGRTCKLHTERTRSDSNPGPSCCEATELTTEPLCRLLLQNNAEENNSKGCSRTNEIGGLRISIFQGWPTLMRMGADKISFSWSKGHTLNKTKINCELSRCLPTSSFEKPTIHSHSFPQPDDQSMVTSTLFCPLHTWIREIQAPFFVHFKH